MPRKLGPRHAKSHRALATVNRLASAANDIQRLAWHDHQTEAGEAPVSTFAPAPAVDRQAARSLATLWGFTRRLAAGYQMAPVEVDQARRAVNALYNLALFGGREHGIVQTALDKVNVLPRAETARAISGILARIARWRCNWNSNAAYKAREDRRGTVWSEGALWNPPALSIRAKAAKALAAEARRNAAAASVPVPAAAVVPELTVLPGGGQPVPAPADDDIDPESSQALFGLRGLRRIGLGAVGMGSIFARHTRRAGGKR